jgi:hypothetical protein
MAVAELITAGSMIAGTVANRLRPKPKFSKIDTGRIRGIASARLANQNALTQANIKQAGAARRLPSGAIASNLAGINQQVVDPNLDSAVTDIQRFNAGQETRESLAQTENFDNMLNFNLAGAGTLAKLALLRRHGFLGAKTEEGQGGNINELATSIGLNRFF